MKKYFLIFVILALSACGLRYSPAINTNSINELNISSISRESKECGYGLLWFPPIAGQSVSVVETAKNKGFNKILFVDEEFSWYLFFNKTCVIVYGQ